MLNKNQIIENAEITDYSSDGSGVCRIEGRAVFVKGAMKGELWNIKILKATKTAVYALGLKRLSPSSGRIEPACPVFGPCGGCGLQHMDYGEELDFKLSRVNEAIKRIGGLDFTISRIRGAENTGGYRNKAVFAVGNSGAGPVTGFYRGRSHDIVPVTDCLLQSAAAGKAALALRDWMREFSVPAYDEKTGGGAVRHLYVRTGSKTGEGMAVVVTARPLENTRELIAAIREKCPGFTGILENRSTGRGNTVLSGSFKTLWGRDYINDELLGLRFRLSPLSFYQINPSQAEALYSLALDYARPEGKRVLDLYCGTGTIGLCMAGRAGEVIGAEIVEQAVRDAERNARENGIENARFICADAGQAAEALASQGLRPDVVVTDPPRKGMDGQTIEAVLGMSPERLVYVSCDPGTLARDLKLLVQGGYVLQKGECVDMFPRTKHVETCVLLSRLTRHQSGISKPSGNCMTEEPAS